MVTFFIRSLSPLQRIFFLIGIAFLVGGVTSILGVNLLKVLYGLSLPQDYEMLKDYDKPWIVGANKFLLFTQHLGFMVLPGFILVYLSGTKNLILSSPKRNLLIAAVALGLVLYPAVTFLSYINQQIPLSESLLEMEKSAGLFTMAIVRAPDLATLCVNLFLVALVPAVGEELVFRGILQREIHLFTKNGWTAVVLSAFIFSALHMQFGGFIPRFVLGLVLGWIFLRTGNLVLSMAMHFANNALALFLVHWLQPSTADVNEFDIPDYDLGSIVLTVGSFALGGLIIYWLNKKSARAMEPIIVEVPVTADEEEKED
ncbi:CPBP family intramembrane glutamic endopeptidase [Luteibaculum oceani]|uniref:CPBP family intramembrane metalloprotease n=1 Tax=Luteibaculum oceani TaxID=1294296 RepID=A0A5C6V559_9FLAO|nr:CPBP family intramembrane glutamic endopeptidase [Luteibaculum oceani]TXC78958.1 CPBP family intramembrane metalloprotease [Luteibaculum oceani]